MDYRLLIKRKEKNYDCRILHLFEFTDIIENETDIFNTDNNHFCFNRYYEL